MKSLEFIYQDTQIHFALQNEGHVMVNATEMAKAFNKETRVFLKTAHAKAFIDVLLSTPNDGYISVKNSSLLKNERAPNGARSENLIIPKGSNKIIDNRGHMGIYFERRLALKFAAWLSPEFEVWVFSTLDTILFGNYKKHWDAHIAQESAKQKMRDLKTEMLINPTADIVEQYFEAEQQLNEAKNTKSKAIRNQYKLF